jgi:colicin import membrane protein
MKRVTIIIAVLAALGIGGYFVLQAQNAAVERPAAEQAAADQAAAEAAEAAAAEAAAAEAAAAEAAAAEAAAAEAAAAEAAAALADQAGEAQDALSALFSVEGFDFDRAMTALEGADIPALARTALTAALAAARDNPDLLPTALAQARNALGLGQ